MADLPENLIYVRHGKAVLALTPAEFRVAVKRGKYIRRCTATEKRAEERLERARREGRRERDSY